MDEETRAGGGGRFILSICGGSGTGKSTLAKLVCEQIGPRLAARIPTDYYLKPNPYPALEDFFRRPLAYDWAAVERALAAPDGAERTAPLYDFTTFRRSAESGGPSFFLRPLVVLDGMLPYPRSNMTVLLEAPEADRRARIAARDRLWHTRVIDRWDQHQRTLRWLMAQPPRFDLVLDAAQPPEQNAAVLVARLREAVHDQPVDHEENQSRMRE